MTPDPTQHVFGPVPSRRLGRSLGVDLVPFKVCSFDCLYCQLGRTTTLTTERRQWVPTAEVIHQVEEALRGGERPDHVTLAGSGEPTLHEALGEVIAGIKSLTDVPVAILTNGSLLWRGDVRADCARADVILPTLASVDEATQQRIHRPAEGLTHERHVEGLTRLREGFPGQIWLEVFLVGGINTAPEQIEGLRRIAERVRADRIQLNTSARPPADPEAHTLSGAELDRLAALFGPGTEVVAQRPGKAIPLRAGVTADILLQVLQRHPSTAAELAAGLGVDAVQVDSLLRELSEQGRVIAMP
ncbi:radical SAM protein, partial [Candidatus Sumerlaeota bacterium]|nr:radical SAM protein [Candidatus Sumerlaeota bacterium]